MTELAVLRRLLAHARANGWDHAIYGLADSDSEHVWRLRDWRVSLYGDELEIQRPGARRSLWCPVDVREAARVLAAAGMVPADLAEVP